jgi:ABC-type nitrate/sulfonate/bicarbonate transport system permease component
MGLEQLPSDLAVTLGRVFAWTTLSWLLGIGAGLACHRSQLLYLAAKPAINLFRHISPFCWLPVVILASGIGEVSVGLILLLAMFFNAVLLTVEIFRSIPREHLEHALMDGASGWAMFRSVELPLALGELVNLYRILWSVAWSAVIAAEMLGVSSGMGYRLLDFRYLLLYKDMFAYIAVIGVVGIGVDAALERLKRALP